MSVSVPSASPATVDVEVVDQFAEYRSSRDRKLRNRLVVRHMYIAERCARQYAHRGEPMADLLQVARMALIGAVERFDPDRDVSFETFAVPTVKGKLRHHFRDNCWSVSVPRTAKDLRSRVSRATEQLGQALGRQPTVVEIADACGVDVRQVRMTIEANKHYRVSSWESYRHDRDDPTTTSRSNDCLDPSADDALGRAEAAACLSILDGRLQQIVRWRFYEECTQREIGARLGIGQVQVSRLLARALEQLRGYVAEPPVR
jgi:RNA polymerase sigma-B factor